MSDTSKLIADLSPEKRKFFELLLEEEGMSVPQSPIVPIRRESNSFPLSFTQERLWFLDQLWPGDPFYNMGKLRRLRGPLNVPAFEQSLNEIVRRHEVLRTTFTTVDGQPVQVIAPALTVPLPVVDLRHLAEARQEAEAQRLAIEEAQRPFDLAHSPLLRATVLRLAEEEHVLLLAMHHIVSDGWSMGVFNRELATLYEAFSTGKPSPLPELPIQYADFAVWQREWLQGEVLETQLAYWKQQLAGAPAILELPTDRPRPVAQSFRGATQSLALSRELSEALTALSQQEGVTLFMTLLAAFETLLHRYTGQDDILVGIPIANRNCGELEGLIGFFVNTLVLRTDLSGNPGFRELLRRVREGTLGAYAHQDLPFEMLVKELQPERDLSRNPLFQVMFALQNVLSSALELPGLTLSPLGGESGTAKFDLTLVMTETEQELKAFLEYNTDLFDAGTVSRMLGHFQTLLEGIVADPDQRISYLPLLLQAERHQLLVEWNDTTTEYPKDQCIHQLFEAWAKRTPDSVAVVFEGEYLTYQELNRRANQLAHHLQGLGVGPEALVGVYIERSLEMIVGLLGILKAGGAYVPLDPAYPKERLAFMLADTRAAVLLTQRRLVERLPEHGARIVYLDTGWEAIAKENEESPDSGVTAGNLAYVIYTSGSTGKPKGVQIEHGSLLNLVFWHQHTFAISQVDRATQVAGLSFDASVWELWPYLTAGASVHIADDETRVLPSQLQEWFVSNAITIGFLPTPLTESILSLDWPEDVTLRTLLTGGDKLNHYPPSFLPFELVNNYGPTENTVVTTSGLVSPKDRADMAPHIGRPVSNTQVYLLDRNLQPVPVRVPGELCIGGDSLARDYLNRPELTAEEFIPNPFPPSIPPPIGGEERGGARLYKTGDLARYLPDGNIEFLGRLDHQVKVRGFRIELGEIEAVLGQHPEVGEAVVLVREDAPNGKRLVAYVVPNDEREPTVSELRRFLQEKLPRHMVPSAFVMLEALPLTPNGKVDRRALPAPDRARPDLEKAFVAPRTSVEGTLADVWAHVLGSGKVSIYDNFFDLGGHSLLATQVMSRVREALRVELPLRTLFEAPTVAGLAERVEMIFWATQDLPSSPSDLENGREEGEL